ncbi:MAG: hypothetical protein IPH98_08165 [Saprospiraceae bacterium]|nr:hypothetical protein [Candidatus Defluviibacterium haderslevense]
MGKINKNELTKLLICWILFCISIVIAEIFQYVFVLLFAFFILGIFLISIIRVKKSNWTGKSELLSLILPLIILILPIDTSDKKLTHAYFKTNIVHFDKLTDLSTVKPHRLIFAFDNSGGKQLIEKKIDSKILPVYKQYCEETKKYCSIACFNNNCYRDLLKARVCYDLAHINCIEINKFLVLKIGDPDISYFSNLLDDYSTCNNINIENLIEQICVSNCVNSVDNISHFENFYQKINDITKDENFNYTLFIYSDFVFDLNTKNNIENHYFKIKTLQNNLLKFNIIQNLFIAPPYGVNRKKLNPDERDILPDEIEPYIKYYKIDSINKMTNVAHEIRETRELLVLYEKNHVSDAVNLLFKENGEVFIRFKENREGYAIYDGNKRYYYSENNPIQNEVITIKYEKSTIPKNIFRIEIIQNGINYIIPCKMEENGITQFYSIIILFLFLWLGLL